MGNSAVPTVVILFSFRDRRSARQVLYRALLSKYLVTFP